MIDSPWTAGGLSSLRKCSVACSRQQLTPSKSQSESQNKSQKISLRIPLNPSCPVSSNNHPKKHPCMYQKVQKSDQFLTNIVSWDHWKPQCFRNILKNTCTYIIHVYKVIPYIYILCKYNMHIYNIYIYIDCYIIDSIDSTYIYIYIYISLYYRQYIHIYIFIIIHIVWHTSHKELPQPLYISQHIVGTWVIRPGTYDQGHMSWWWASQWFISIEKHHCFGSRRLYKPQVVCSFLHPTKS